MALSKSLVNLSPFDVASTILNRSVCAVKVGACLADRDGVWAVGWNSSGPTGYGQHAEVACILRAIKGGGRCRLSGSTLYVAAARGKTITARPCIECQDWTDMVGRVVYRDYGQHIWRELT